VEKKGADILFSLCPLSVFEGHSRLSSRTKIIQDGGLKKQISCFNLRADKYYSGKLFENDSFPKLLHKKTFKAGSVTEL